MILKDKVVVVTGGTGSLGKVLVRRLLSGEKGMPSKIVVFSRGEDKQHDMRVAFANGMISADEQVNEAFVRVLEFRIGDIREYGDVCSVVKGADIVINAAALKQVPACEYFPAQAVMTNCIGAMNVVRAIQEHDYPVKTVVGISTDKACKPVNAMGMSKAMQERIFTSANIQNPKTRFICVRYGNVLASRGSVIPLFHNQIRSGGPVTVTVPKMTRFLLSLDQAVDTVFAALEGANPGETYVPNAPSATVMNIATALIGEREIEVDVTGIRPGEKIHEIMVSEEETYHTTKRGNYYAILPMLPELIKDEYGDRRVLKAEFSSEDNVIDLQQTIELFRQNNLMVGETGVVDGEELLR